MVVSTKRYQKQEMLSLAHEHGFEVTEHLLKDWVEKGLLGEAEREWPGHGSISWWSQAQLDLFLELLALRQKQHKPFPIGGLCTIPIGKWLYLGEEAGGVSLPQVRRAMATWMEYQRKFSPKHIAHCATRMVHRFGSPKVEGKRHLIKHLTALGVFTPRLTPKEIEELTDSEQLQYELIPAFSPPKKVQEKAREECPDVGRYLSMYIPILFRAWQDPWAFLDQPDVLWEWARVVHLLALGGYLHEQPFFASDFQAGRLIAHASLDYLFQGAGFNLLSCLGITQREEYWPLHPILNPQKWLSGEIIPPVIQTKALFTLPLLCSGIYVVKHELCIRQSMMTTRPVRVMLICRFFESESGVMDTSAIPHTFQTYEIEMTNLKNFFRYLSSLIEQKEGTYPQPRCKQGEADGVSADCLGDPF